jgi:hypothetical protein
MNGSSGAEEMVNWTHQLMSSFGQQEAYRMPLPCRYFRDVQEQPLSSLVSHTGLLESDLHDFTGMIQDFENFSLSARSYDAVHPFTEVLVISACLAPKGRGPV